MYSFSYITVIKCVIKLLHTNRKERFTGFAHFCPVMETEFDSVGHIQPGPQAPHQGHLLKQVRYSVFTLISGRNSGHQITIK